MQVNLAVTVDVDNDGLTTRNERSRLSWRGLAIVPELRGIFADHGVRTTWFVRADTQLEQIYGTPCYLLAEHEAWWWRLHQCGDEIAWHPHFYVWDEQAGLYYSDRDAIRCAQAMAHVFPTIQSTPFQLRSVRMGEAFHGNALMQTAAHLGLEVDSTALPGRLRCDEQRAFDWSTTPNHPYYPGRRDYRRPDPTDSLPVLEIPITTTPVQSFAESRPYLRYLNLAYHPPIFRRAIDGIVMSLERQESREAYITTIVHPDEVLEVNAESHALYAFSTAAVRQNIDYALQILAADGRSCRAGTLTELRANFARSLKRQVA